VLQGGNIKRDPSGITSERAANLLQQVLTAGVKIHGAPSTHVTLAVVLAEKGMIKQLRTFLMVRPSVSLRKIKFVFPLLPHKHTILIKMFMICTNSGHVIDFCTLY
jgi:hypothetical protein